MKLNTDDLTLFGLDLSQGLGGLKLAWRELWWGDNSAVARSMAETVKVHCAASEEIFYVKAGVSQFSADSGEKTSVLLLDDARVLHRRIQVPAAAEASLEGVVALEVEASSPFSAEDTRYGWRMLGARDGFIVVDLAIANNIDIRKQLVACPAADEVWASTESEPVVLTGYGESKRQGRFASRLKSLWFKFGAILFLLCLLPAMVSGFRFLQLEKVKQQYEALKLSSENSVKLKAELNRNNGVAQHLSDLIDQNPDPLMQLQFLTDKANDEVWLRTFNLSPGRLQVTGYAVNAADLISELSELPTYDQVKQQGGIRRDRASGNETFTLDIKLSEK